MMSLASLAAPSADPARVTVFVLEDCKRAGVRGVVSPPTGTLPPAGSVGGGLGT